jgi:hypothetical protein
VSADPVLLLAWLVLAHLVADFILQTDSVAADKSGHGRQAMRGLGLHVAAVFLCLLPFVVAFGVPGLVAALAISAAHAAIDRAKIVLTRRAEARALLVARADHEEPAPAASLGTAWTPVPAALFALDQLAHVVVIAFAWITWLAAAPIVDPYGSVVTSILGRWDPATVHRAILVGVVIAALAVVNIRAASFFVATLVRPRETLTGHDAPAEPADEAADATERAAGDDATTRSDWTVRVGPIRAHATGTTFATGSPAPASAAAAGSGAPPAREHSASPARVGATIGILERLLIVAFMMTGAQAAVGFVVAAKTIARFRQLDDRHFAEYYLLGTLASVSVALGSALIATATLAAG